MSKATFYGKQGTLWSTIEALFKVLSDRSFLTDLKALKEYMYFSRIVIAKYSTLLDAIDRLVVRTRQRSSNITDTKRVELQCYDRLLYEREVFDGISEPHRIYVRQFSLELNCVTQHVGERRIGRTINFLQIVESDRSKDSLNYKLSHSRQSIEHAFGMLEQRWGILSNATSERSNV